MVDILREMGIRAKATEVKTATQKRFPNGLTRDQIDETVITYLFKHLKSRGKDEA